MSTALGLELPEDGIKPCEEVDLEVG
ncbi:hypothetical protein CCACVL1_21576 [Corchorus capsularis]|uniref:Uncharacterized protein n=1 Tax=Corchorus capsularis TaxID=210143 RepID=A0A1R3H4G1_COCAP|nr:hypothetical protein CCACVL1_21576 [Corchorus capsularis]